MTTTRIDYVGTYLYYKTPIPITGEPTFESLKRLKNELRANASSVDTELGGEYNGYLWLALTDEEYRREHQMLHLLVQTFQGYWLYHPEQIW